jgi:hypothetical protein
MGGIKHLIPPILFTFIISQMETSSYKEQSFKYWLKR